MCVCVCVCQAGEMFLSVEMVKEGLDMYMAGEAWDKAREIARNIAPRSTPSPTHTHTDTERESTIFNWSNVCSSLPNLMLCTWEHAY